jgi:murein L,D-transpeptidase YafK
VYRKWRRGEEETRSWRKLKTVYSSPDIIRIFKSRTRLAKYIARMGEMRVAYKFMVEKREGKRQFGKLA